MSQPIIFSYTLQFLRYSLNKILKIKASIARSNHGHTYTPNQCPHQLSTSYTLRFPRYSLDKIFTLKVTMARPNQGHTMTLHTYTPNQCPYQVSTSYSLWSLRYSLDKLFPTVYLPIRTPWVKTIPQQPLRTVG